MPRFYSIRKLLVVACIGCGVFLSRRAVFAQTAQVRLLVDGGQISLPPSSYGAFTVLPDTPFVVTLTTDSTQVPITAAFVNLNGETVLLSSNAKAAMSQGKLQAPILEQFAARVASFISPGTGSQPMNVHVQYADGSAESLEYVVRVVPFGTVTEPSGAAAGALVGLYQRDDRGIWNEWAPPFSTQKNPEVVSANGEIGWYVPNGVYDVRAEFPTFIPLRTDPITVVDNIVDPNVRLVVAPTQGFLPLLGFGIAQYQSSDLSDWVFLVSFLIFIVTTISLVHAVLLPRRTRRKIPVARSTPALIALSLVSSLLVAVSNPGILALLMLIVCVTCVLGWRVQVIRWRKKKTGT